MRFLMAHFIFLQVEFKKERLNNVINMQGSAALYQQSGRLTRAVKIVFLRYCFLVRGFYCAD